jgi:AsmA protein
MARALFTFGGLCIVFIILLLGLPFFLPVGSYMAKVSEDVNQKTGRDLKVHGDVSFRLFPSIRLTANKVTISNPPGFSAPEFASLDQFALSVKLIPLFYGQIEVDKFVLDHPRIAIETLADGRTNMEFDDQPKSSLKSKKSAPTDQTQTVDSTNINFPNGLSLREVKMIDGEITIKDDRHGTIQKFDGISVSVRLPSLEDELSVDGKMNYGRHAFDMKVTLAPFGPFMSGASAKLHVLGHAPAINLRFDGSVDMDARPIIQGAVKVDAPSMPELMTFLDYPAIADYTDLGALALTGELNADRNKAALSAAKLTLGPVAATGDLAADLLEKPPHINGRMQVRGAAGMIADLDVPMIITGPVNNIQVRPDVESLVKDKLGSTSDLVNALVKMKDKSPDQPQSDPAEAAKDMIKGLFKK